MIFYKLMGQKFKFSLHTLTKNSMFLNSFHQGKSRTTSADKIHPIYWIGSFTLSLKLKISITYSRI